MSKLSHITASGEAHMVDVSQKAVTTRVATAEGRIVMKPETLALCLSGDAKKGDVLGTARIAGIMAAKKKTIDIRNCASTGVQVAAAWSTVIDSAPRPPRAAGVVITDDGGAGQKLVDFLIEKKLI